MKTTQELPSEYDEWATFDKETGEYTIVNTEEFLKGVDGVKVTRYEKDYRYLDENGREWAITQEEMDEKIKYLKDNVYEEDGKKYILVRDIVKIIPEGHPIIEYWEGMLNE